ncbi:MAG: hypothetical protein ISP86_01720 [Shewanellaceae bacterium]|nr:hypothetical protein [Shewanellaceae bacterium]
MIKKTKWFMLFIALGSLQAEAASPNEHPFLESHVAHPTVSIPAPADFTQDSLQLRRWLEQTLAQSPPQIDFQTIVERMQQVSMVNRAGLDQAADILFNMLEASTVYSPEIKQAITTLYASKLDFVADQVLPLVFGGSLNPELLERPAYYIDQNFLSHPSQRFSLNQTQNDYVQRIQHLFSVIHAENEASIHLRHVVAAMIAWHVEPVRLFTHPSIANRSLNYAQFLELNVQAQFMKQLDSNFADMTYQELMLLGQTITVEQPIVLDLLMQQIHNNMPADTTFWPSFACEDTGQDLHSQAQCYANEIHYVWGLKEHLDTSRDIIDVQQTIKESFKDESYYPNLVDECRTHQSHWICKLDMPKDREFFLKNINRLSAAGLLESHLKMQLSEAYHLNLDELQLVQDQSWFRWQMRTCGYYWASFMKLCTSRSVLNFYDVALLSPTLGFFYIFPHPRTGDLIYLKVNLEPGENKLQWKEIHAAQMDKLQSNFFSEAYPGLTKQIPIWDGTKFLRHGFTKLFLQDEQLQQQLRQHQNPHARYEVKHVWEHFIPFYDSYIDVLNGDYGMLMLDTAASIFVVATAGVGEAVDASAVAVREVGVAVEAISEKIAAGEALSQAEHVTFHEGVSALRYAGTSIGKAALRMVDPGVEMAYHIGSGVGRFGVYSIKGIRNFAKSLTSRLARDVPACATGLVRHRRSADTEDVAAACAVLRRRLSSFAEDSEAAFGESRRSSGYSSRRSSLHSIELPDIEIKNRLDAMRGPLALIEHLDVEWKALSYESIIKADAGINEALQVNKMVEKGAYSLQPHPLWNAIYDRSISNVFQDAYHNKFIQMKGEFYRVKMVLPAGLDKTSHVTGEYGDVLFFLRQENYAMKDFYEVSYNFESEAWDVTGKLYSDVMTKPLNVSKGLQIEQMATQASRADEVSEILDLNNGIHIDEMTTEVSRADVKALMNSDELYFNADFGAKIASVTSKDSSLAKSNILEGPVWNADELTDVEDGFTSSLETDTTSGTTTTTTTTSSKPTTSSDPDLEDTFEDIQEIEDFVADTETEVNKGPSRQVLQAGKRHHTLGKHIRVSKAELLKRVEQTKVTQASHFGVHVEQGALSNLNHYRREVFAEDVIYRALNHEFDLLQALTKVGSKQSLHSLTATENALLKSHGYLASGIKEDLMIGQKFVLRHTFDEATGIKVIQSGELSDTNSVAIVMEYVKETELWKIITAFTE